MSTFHWEKASRAEMFAHLCDLHDALVVTSALLQGRDEDRSCGTETSKRWIARSEELLKKQPGKVLGVAA